MLVTAASMSAMRNARPWFAAMAPLHDGPPVADLPEQAAPGYRTGRLGQLDG